MCRPQVKEMSLIRNTILECQVCGESAARFWTFPGIWNPNLTCLSVGFHEPRPRCSPNPCFKGVACMDSPQYPGYVCGPCPPGTTGNGTHCSDIDEVRDHNHHRQTSPASSNAPPPPQCELQPCFSPEACVNTMGGFSCRPCPPGLWGPPLAGTGQDYAKAHKQVRPKGATPQHATGGRF